MKRQLTNLVRYVMDELFPPILRDNRYFMYPFFRYWFAGSENLQAIMSFKDRVHSMTEEEFVNFYKHLKCRALDRPTDASEESLDFVLNRIDPQSKSLLDVGCGRGYWLSKCANRGLELYGCDIYKDANWTQGSFQAGNVEALPFPDKSFDTVTCFHVLEHVRHLELALKELSRVARRQLCIIVPCQRYFKYTLDLHIHFFYSAAYFQSLMGLKNAQCELVAGDIVYIADMTQ